MKDMKAFSGTQPPSTGAQNPEEARYASCTRSERAKHAERHYVLKDGETFKVDISEPGTFLGGVTGHIRKSHISETSNHKRRTEYD
jgi:hypothetical protein